MPRCPSVFSTVKNVTILFDEAVRLFFSEVIYCDFMTGFYESDDYLVNSRFLVFINYSAFFRLCAQVCFCVQYMIIYVEWFDFWSQRF